jgi:hypothetical protein
MKGDVQAALSIMVGIWAVATTTTVAIMIWLIVDLRRLTRPVPPRRLPRARLVRPGTRR